MLSLLAKSGDIPENEYCDIISGYMLSADSGSAAEFLYGIILTGRDILFTSERVIPCIDGAVSRMNEEEFMAALPKLRCAFTSLLPAETARIAEQVSVIHGINRDKLAGSAAFTQGDIIAARRADENAALIMEKWGLCTEFEKHFGDGDENV